ncbi:hypothetical protein ACFE04_021733 [Oxalis oulophora]
MVSSSFFSSSDANCSTLDQAEILKGNYGADYVVESSGIFMNIDKASKHLQFISRQLVTSKNSDSWSETSDKLLATVVVKHFYANVGMGLSTSFMKLVSWYDNEWGNMCWTSLNTCRWLQPTKYLDENITALQKLQVIERKKNKIESIDGLSIKSIDVV